MLYDIYHEKFGLISDIPTAVVNQGLEIIF